MLAISVSGDGEKDFERCKNKCSYVCFFVIRLKVDTTAVTVIVTVLVFPFHRLLTFYEKLVAVYPPLPQSVFLAFPVRFDPIVLS